MFKFIFPVSLGSLGHEYIEDAGVFDLVDLFVYTRCVKFVKFLILKFYF